jgi:hypothetical protein
MEELNSAVSTAKLLIEEAASYEVKPTKASSKRLRVYLTAIKQTATPAKKELLQADKA